VIALVIAEPTEDSARKNCLESLPDFLHDSGHPPSDPSCGALADSS
jgi:hypothetical protein